MNSSGNKKIGIIGGGILGMTLALRLSEAGCRVTILEKDEHIGGLLKPIRIGNHPWDRFYHVTLLSDTHLLGLLEGLGLRNEIEWGETKTGFYTDGRLYSMSNIFEFLNFPPLSLFDKLRLGLTIFYASRIKAWERLEAVEVSDWLIRFSGRRNFEKIWLPLLKSKLGDNYRITSAAFIWATIARMYAARRTGLKKEMFGYVRGGYATVLNRFEQVLRQKDVDIRCGTAVEEITCMGNGARCRSERGEDMHFDAVIATIPGSEIPALCPALTETEKTRLRSVTYEGVICPALLLRRPLAGYYVTNITDGRLPFTAVIEMTALVDRKNFKGHSLIYLPRYLSPEDPLWSKADGEIVGEFLSALETMYSTFTRDDVVDAVVPRARQVMPVPTLHYSTESLPSARTSVKNFMIVNSAQIANGTMNINEIVGLAGRKSEELAKILLCE